MKSLVTRTISSFYVKLSKQNSEWDDTIVEEFELVEKVKSWLLIKETVHVKATDEIQEKSFFWNVDGRIRIFDREIPDTTLS